MDDQERERIIEQIESALTLSSRQIFRLLLRDPNVRRVAQKTGYSPCFVRTTKERIRRMIETNYDLHYLDIM